MADNKTSETTKKDENRKESPIKNNPFDAYKSDNQGGEKPYLYSRQKQYSSSSPRSNSSLDRDERSHSRQMKNASGMNQKQEESQGGEDKGKNDDKNYRERAQRPSKANNQSLIEEAYFKTKLCPLYEKGQCKKGSACNFAHGEKQLRGLPNFRKTRLCIPFKNGQCSKPSHDCKYAHGQAELRKLQYDYVPSKGQAGLNRPERREKYEGERGGRRHRESPGYHEERRGGYRHERDSRGMDEYRDNRRAHKSKRTHSPERSSRPRDHPRRSEKEFDPRPYQLGPPTEMFPPYGYMYTNPYMVNPPPGGPSMGGPFGGSSGEMYGGGSGGNVGGGSGMPPPSSFSGSGSGYQGGPYGYGYGYVPHGYSSSYGSSSKPSHM